MCCTRATSEDDEKGRGKYLDTPVKRKAPVKDLKGRWRKIRLFRYTGGCRRKSSEKYMCIYNQSFEVIKFSRSNLSCF